MLLFENCSPPIKLRVLKESKNELFFKWASLMETDEDIDFKEVISIGNKKFKGRFLKYFKEYKSKQQTR